jgi:hypothetical protein
MQKKLITVLAVPLIAALTAQAAAGSERHHRQAKGRAVASEQLLNSNAYGASVDRSKALFTMMNTWHRLRMAVDQTGPRRRAVHACSQRNREASCPCRVSRLHGLSPGVLKSKAQFSSAGGWRTYVSLTASPFQ